jgi:hypothetical protein
MMAATLEKPCFSCGQQVKLERKPDNSGWLLWNLDGTKHVDFKKQQPQQQQGSSLTYQKLEELQKEISELKGQIENLVVGISNMRLEFTREIRELNNKESKK